MELLAVEEDLLGARLAGEEMPVRLTVIEHIPFSVHQRDAPVGVAAVIERLCVAVGSDIRVGDQHAAVVILAQRGVRYSPTQLIFPKTII